MKLNFISGLLAIIIIHFSLISFSQTKFFSFTDGKSEFEIQKTVPERITNNTQFNEIELQFNFTGALISEKDIKGESYQHFHIDGLTHTGQIGAPSLPLRNEIIAMPKGSKGTIEILETEYYEYQDFNIHPVLELARDTEGAPEPEFIKDEAIYSMNMFYPQNIVDIANTAYSRSTPLAKVSIVPVQYNPHTKTVRVYTSIRFKFSFSGGMNSFDYIAEENSINYTNLLKLNVLNSESIPDGIIRNESNKTDSKNYIIITHSEFESQAEALANWKRQLGYSVEIVSNENWSAETVKTAIESRYESWTPKPDYFVIIGDHSGSFEVPGEIHDTQDGSETFASDLYFACMDGSGDWHPDMAHGRISVASVDEAEIVINKIIDYEKNPTDEMSFYENILNCAQYQDDDDDGYADRRFCHTSEEIRDYLQDVHAYTSERIYYTSTSADITNLHYNAGYYSSGQLLPDELRDLSFNWNGGSSHITNAIDNGKFMVFHRDHGYVGGSGWAHPYYTTSSINNLNNQNLLPVVFSINCHTGEFQLPNCFSEKLLRVDNKGAVGVVGAAFYSYSGYNDAISIGMIDAIWADPGLYPDFGSAGTGSNYTIGVSNAIYTMGDVVNQGLYAMEQNFFGYTSSDRYSYELFHYFGDPAMKIWTDNPYESPITAVHSNEISSDENEFQITNSTPYATATLLFNDQLLSSVTLDENGDGSISYIITAAGDEMTLTISKHNHFVYTAELTVTGSSLFAPVVETNQVENITDESAIMSGEIMSDGNDDILESGIVISTLSNPILNEQNVINIETDPLVTMGVFNCTAENLESNTVYYYRAYTANSVDTAYGEEDLFETLCAPVELFPWSISFEDDIDFTDCWYQEYISGDDINWIIEEGDAWSGNNYISFSDNDHEEDNTILYSPLFDLSQLSNVKLSYWYHIQESFVGYDELKTYFRSDLNDEWTELNHIIESTEDWTEVILDLSEISNKCQFALSGYNYHGNGIIIDMITIDQIIDIESTQSELTLYPNPNSGIFTIDLGESMQSIVNIYNVNGQIIYSEHIDKGIGHFNISKFTSGIYTVQIIQGENVYQKNLIIQ
jgi:adenylate kinase family enzyme